jgi:sugar/nucleoside kinase (ribokinase family)
MSDARPAELIGVGSPLVDLLLAVTDIFLTSEVPGAKGGMELVDADLIARLVAASGKEPLQVAGGAAANTTVGCAALGIQAAFVGCCGKDDLAAFYRRALVERGCEPRLVEHPTQPTGRVLSLVTPDAQRTLRTCLGAAAAMDPGHFTAETFAGAKIVMLEGYALFNHDLARAVARAATAAGADLALDLASFEVVKANRAVLDELIRDHVDIVFANEDEAAAWNPDGPQAALEDLAARVGTVVVKLGKEGALLADRGQRVRVSADAVEAVDTTGAGDCFAAGFLAARLRGLDLEQCGRMGSRCGTAIVQVMGAQLPPEQWLRLKGYLDAWR